MPRALTNNGDGDEEMDGIYEEDFDDDNDESFYVGDVECIADVSFVSDVDGNGDVKLLAKKLKMEEEKDGDDEREAGEGFESYIEAICRCK